MKIKTLLLAVVFLALASFETNAQSGTVDCSQVIKSTILNKDMHYSVYLPPGYNTSNRFTGDLPATIYMVEIRDSRFVHPTLQKVAHNIGRQITHELGIRLNVDPEPNRFDVKRGEQDIIAID